ncbi:MAG TPA: hypothetical protein VMA32_09015 [Streptosporangiaceae bacterium]|nr:hypothetical protein [Streptosporangiaceae bacterium]
MTAMTASAWTRITRRLGWDGNPLRPRSDLIARWLLPAAIVAFAALCPVVAGVTGMWVRADNAAVEHAKLAWHPVTAVLLYAVPGPAESNHGGNTWTTWAPARWTVGGRQHAGDVPAPATSNADTRLTVWLNRAGQPQMPPLTPGEVGDRAHADTLIALSVLAVLLTGSCCLARWVLFRRRLQDWQLEWLTVGPLWSRQG